jgi:hypothetical protein
VTKDLLFPWAFLKARLFLVPFLLAFLALSPLISAQTASIPDLSGIWDISHLRGNGSTNPLGPGNIPFTGFSQDEPSMHPQAAEQYKAARRGVANPWDKGADAVDPTQSCYPYGPTRSYTVPRPWEIRQLPDITLILFERDHGVRRVFTDGRGHPDGYLVTWMGHSIGRYDGDTLVVDTVALQAQSWLDQLGHPHSDALHLVERFRLLDRNTLQILLTFDDPKAFTTPWTGKKVFLRGPPGLTILDDSLCEEWLELRDRRLY